MKYFTLILLFFCTLSFADTEYAEPKPSFDNPRKIVFSVTEGSEHALDHILSVANNVLKFYGPENVQMKIVAYSQGIALLNKHNPTTAVRVDALMQYEVEFIACGNTMRTLKIKEEDLVEGSEIVTAGVVELLESVQKGWIYIKP
ncbi:MAG: DsrE family protein [Campylobacterales bacterium]|nr:DsrE family protein [Campylobacterales bacterium]